MPADNADAACECVHPLADGPLGPAEFHDAVALAVAQGLIRDPIRIPQGSLQCHWRLELTLAGATRVLSAGA
jgi:hypothetical protein